MPKFLVQANYVGEGLKGLIKEGGTKRRETVAKVIEGMGGTLESFYYAFGDYDVVGVADMPDNLSSVAFSIMVNASGMINAKTTVLLTPEDIDQATKKVVEYRPPGQYYACSIHCLSIYCLNLILERGFLCLLCLLKISTRHTKTRKCWLLGLAQLKNTLNQRACLPLWLIRQLAATKTG